MSAYEALGYTYDPSALSKVHNKSKWIRLPSNTARIHEEKRMPEREEQGGQKGGKGAEVLPK